MPPGLFSSTPLRVLTGGEVPMTNVETKGILVNLILRQLREMGLKDLQEIYDQVSLHSERMKGVDRNERTQKW